MLGSTRGGSSPAMPVRISVGMSLPGSSQAPYTEYSRSVVTTMADERASHRQYMVAAAFVTAYSLFGSTASLSAGAWSLYPYSEDEPVFTKLATPASRHASRR